MKKSVIIAIWMIFTVSFAFAGQPEPHEPEAAMVLLRESMTEVVKVIEDQDLTVEEQRERIEAIVDPVFNYELIARLALGPRNWPRLDREQRRIFIDRFVNRLKESYFQNVAVLEGDEKTQLSFGDLRVENNRVHIPVRAAMKDTAVNMLYKFHLSETEGWQVYDVEVNGVSIVASFRSQFTQVLAEHSVDELLEKLKTLEAPAVE